jgi:hypothetical protein
MSTHEEDIEWNNAYQYVSTTLKNNVELPLQFIVTRHPSPTASTPQFHMDCPEDEQIIQDVQTLAQFKKQIRRMRANITILEECTTDHKQMGIIDNKGFLTRCIKLDQLRNRVGETNMCIQEVSRNIRISGHDYALSLGKETESTLVDETDNETSECGDDDSEWMTSPRPEPSEDTPQTAGTSEWVFVTGAPTTSATMGEELDDTSSEIPEELLDLSVVDHAASCKDKKNGLQWLVSAFLGQSTSHDR